MFTLIKEFNCKDVVHSLKHTIEERPGVRECITKVLRTEEQGRCLTKWWQKNDTGWPLATCMTVAHYLERSLLLSRSLAAISFLALSPH